MPSGAGVAFCVASSIACVTELDLMADLRFFAQSHVATQCYERIVTDLFHAHCNAVIGRTVHQNALHPSRSLITIIRFSLIRDDDFDPVLIDLRPAHYAVVFSQLVIDAA